MAVCSGPIIPPRRVWRALGDEDGAETNPVRRERPARKFASAYDLPGDANDAEVGATYTDRVLDLRVSKREPGDSSRQIPIS
ncbi:MAG: Hsp20 family protein [Bryobacterales bacterium]|nr:Hsp20 family protein [Bryobacterales bacterium]